MSNDVEFLGEQELESEKEKSGEKKISGITNFFLKIGLAKNEKSANVVMAIITIAVFALTIFIIARYLL